MIPRYTSPEMGALWTDQAKLETWVRVEVLACEAPQNGGSRPGSFRRFEICIAARSPSPRRVPP